VDLGSPRPRTPLPPAVAVRVSPPPPPGGVRGQDSFPRQHARTRGFSLGQPRAFRIAPDGSRVAFLRSAGPEDPRTGLWVIDLAGGGDEHPVAVPGEDPADLPAEERARRERAREQAGGITTYATDRAVRQAVYALGGRLEVADLVARTVRGVEVGQAAIDPRLDPGGRRIAYVSEGALRVVEVDGATPRTLLAPEGDEITWGLAEFIAAEEMGRSRGYWWSPDGARLVVARVDPTPVTRWHIAEPAEPGRAPAVTRYPRRGPRMRSSG
jgi:dipeptidyl-peptidase 4